MVQDQNQFVLDFKDGKINVQRHSIGGQTIFKIIFSDKRSPLVITRALHANANRFWTSIPEGRQREAEEVGPLISEYFKTNN
jgi:hypothetical protein